MNLLNGDFGSLVGVGLLALTLAAAVGAAGARSPLAVALHLAITGAALGAAIAAFGASGPGLLSAVALGGAAPLVVLAVWALVPRVARLRQDGPPAASIAVAVALAAGLVWAGRDAPPLTQPIAAEMGPAPIGLLLSLGVLGLGITGAGVMAMLGFGERAENLRAPEQPRRRRRLTEEDPS